MFMSLKTLDWDPELLEFFGVDKSCLAQIVSNSQVYADMKCGSKLDGVPIAGLVGDQQGALVGNKCFQPGQAKVSVWGEGAGPACLHLHLPLKPCREQCRVRILQLPLMHDPSHPISTLLASDLF